MDVKFSGRRILLCDDWVHCISSLKLESQMVKSLYCSTAVLQYWSTSNNKCRILSSDSQNITKICFCVRCLGNANNVSRTLCMVFLHAKPFMRQTVVFHCMSYSITDSLWGGESSPSETGSYLIILAAPQWDYQLGHSSLMICRSADPYPRPSMLWRR